MPHKNNFSSFEVRFFSFPIFSPSYYCSECYAAIILRTVLPGSLQLATSSDQSFPIWLSPFASAAFYECMYRDVPSVSTNVSIFSGAGEVYDVGP